MRSATSLNSDFVTAPVRCKQDLKKVPDAILSPDTFQKGSFRGRRYRACLSTDVLDTILLNFSRQ
jgi:hypothetical protein